MNDSKKAEILKSIEDMTGMRLIVCTDFKEKRNSFNVTLSNSTVIFNREFNNLKRFSEKYKTITVQENGYNRALITSINQKP